MKLAQSIMARPSLRGCLAAVAAPVLAIAYIETMRTAGMTPAAPFLVLLVANIVAAVVDGRRGGMIAALIASGYVMLAASIGFGPEYLVGTTTHIVTGIALFLAVGYGLGALRDRSSQQQSELAAYAAAHYQSLVENAPEAICVADNEGRIVRVNRKFSDMFRIPAGRSLPDSIGDISATQQSDGSPSGELARDYLNLVINGGPMTFEWRHRRLDGEEFDAEVALVRLPADGQVLVRGLIRDITERKRIDRLRHGEAEVLRLIASDADLKPTLEQLTRVVEEVLPGAICTILLLDEDGERVRHGASPGLTTAFSEAIDGERIGPEAGSCGTAMYTGEQVITENIETDPRWDAYRPLAKAEGLRSCWSLPIKDSRETVRGSLAVYFREPREPIPSELGILERLCSLAGISIESWRKSDAIAHNAEVFEATFEEAAVGMAQVHPDGHYISVNREFSELLGYPREQLQQMSFRDIAHPDDVDEMADAVMRLQSGEIDSFHAETRGIRPDGSTVWVNLSIGTVWREDRLERMIVVAQDISRAHELSEQLVYEVKHDSLTGLTNRREFERYLVSLLREVNNGDTTGAFLYLDLDQFKLVNDTAGHIAGDALLRQLAPILQKHVRHADVVARLGGDEFGVLLRGCDEQATIHVANNLLKAIREFVFTWEERSFRLSGSIGAVQLEADRFPGATDVMQLADTVCYAAKDAGRDRVLLWQENDESLFARRGEMEWVPRLNEALEKGDLFLAGQPILGVAVTQQEKWMELLIRLQDGDKAIPPGAFMPAAERYGIAPRIDWFVIETACEWLRSHDRPQDFRLSINLSGLTISDTGFLDRLDTLLTEIGTLARQLCFEITETAAIANLSDATRMIETVRGHGCTFALDDFGSGLSSFSYLKNLPVDYIKIDGSFVRDLVDNPIDAAIVTSIREISRSMDKQTIAEFVENQAIMDALREIGIDYAQGFHLGRPAPLIGYDSDTEEAVS
ncbi:MAG: EAL domain-containing protein [Gammaproteobacteria bacterium]|nr:EAL domain-containing protein [Gammaproteobacteria bacterium]